MKKICILYTGGTIAMGRNSEGVLVPLKNADELLRFIPSASQIADITTEILFQIDSSDFTPEYWVMIANRIQEKYKQYDGFVIVHGTDTMAYTATALSFMLQNLGKPVILTGSQIPMSDIVSDGQNNLLNAILVASSNISGVAIMFGDYLLQGNRSTKLYEFTLNSFASPNFPPLAELGVDLRLSDHCKPLHSGTPTLKTNLVTDIAVIKLFPGITNEHLLGMVPPRTKGVIIESYGTGNIPLGNSGIQESIEEILNQDIVIAISTQCLYGEVEYNRYAGGYLAKSKGALSCRDMTKEAGVIKMMWVLGQTEEHAEIQRLYEKNVVGELTELTNGI